MLLGKSKHLGKSRVSCTSCLADIDLFRVSGITLMDVSSHGSISEHMGIAINVPKKKKKTGRWMKRNLLSKKRDGYCRLFDSTEHKIAGEHLR